MAGILANSVSRTMLAAETATDKSVSGYVALEEVTFTVEPTGSSYQWAIAKPSDSTARCTLSDETNASPTITPDVGGFFTLACVVDGTTTYVIRLAVVATGAVNTMSIIRLTPIANAAVPTPSTGRSVYYSSDASALVEKRPDGTVHVITVV